MHRAVEKPQPYQVTAEPYGILRELMLPGHAAPAQIPGQALPCWPLTGCLKTEQELFVPKPNRPSGAHHRRAEFPRILGTELN